MSIFSFFKSFGAQKSVSELGNMDSRLLADIGVSVSSVRPVPMRSPFEIGTDRV